MGSGSSKSEEKVVQVKPVVVEKPKFTYEKIMSTRPESSASEDSTKEPEKPKGTPPPPVVTWEEILAQHDQEEEEPEREQFVAPRATFPIGIGPYASLGKPRKRPETKLKKRKTPKPEPKTVEELLITDSEEEEDEEEEVEEESKELENISVPRPKTNQTETRATTVITVVNNEDNSADDDDDSDIEFGSQFSGLNTVYSGPDVLFVAPETNMPSKEIVDQGKHQYAYGQYPMSFSPVQSQVDLRATTKAPEIRYTKEEQSDEENADPILNAYFQPQMTKTQQTNKTPSHSDFSDSEEEEDMSWLEDGRINKQMG